MTLGFAIPNYDSDDANENLKKLNKLIQSLYPGYTQLASGATVLASPPLSRIKFANLIIDHTNPFRGLLGYIKSLSTDFQINSKGVFMKSHVSPGRQTIYPRVLSFNITFQPLHEVAAKAGSLLSGATSGFDKAIAEIGILNNKDA